MLKCAVKDSKHPMIIMGLSEVNIVRLKAGQPITATIESFGIDLPGAIALIYGESEQAIFEELKREGMIDEGTAVHRDPKLDEQAFVRRYHPNLLIATVGLPRSGKSTWAKSQGYPIVCPDAIRLAIHGQRFNAECEDLVWVTVYKMIRALFYAGHNKVILDATNNTWKRRVELLSRGYDVAFKLIPTPADVCIARAKEMHDEEIIPTIERMRRSSNDPWQVGVCKWSHRTFAERHLAKLKQDLPGYEFGIVKIHQEIL